MSFHFTFVSKTQYQLYKLQFVLEHQKVKPAPKTNFLSLVILVALKTLVKRSKLRGEGNLLILAYHHSIIYIIINWGLNHCEAMSLNKRINKHLEIKHALHQMR